MEKIERVKWNGGIKLGISDRTDDWRRREWINNKDSEIRIPER
jgi:hypothetical protein